MKTPRSVAGLVLWVGLCLLVEFASAAFVASSVQTWYPTLEKPSWGPPNWLFAPVWTALYIAMGVAAWLVWSDRGFQNGRVPLLLFFIQLGLNGLWTVIFFGLRAPGPASVEIALLWLVILATLISFQRTHRWAGALLVPYLVWVTYAASLNFAIWRIN